MKSLKISTKVETTILVFENECLVKWPNIEMISETMLMMFNRLPEKKPQFQKIRKLKNLVHFNRCILMSRALAVLEFLLSQTLMLLQDVAKGWNSLGLMGH